MPAGRRSQPAAGAPAVSARPVGLTRALSRQSLTAALAARRFKELTFQEEYSTLFPAAAQP